MTPTMLTAITQLEPKSNRLPTEPARAALPSRQPSTAHRNGDDIELQSPSQRHGNAHQQQQQQEADLDLEMSSQPPSPTARNGGTRHRTFSSQSVTDSPMNKFRLACCCLTNFLNGMNDAAPGALIPYMEEYYHIGYATVSLIFIGNALGFILAAPWIDKLRISLGRARALVLSQCLITAGYVPMVSLAPFPAVVVSFFLIGFGISVNLAICNVFCANQARGSTALGLMHGSYGLGGTISPLIATAFVAVAKIPWGRFYLITMGLSLVTLLFAVWSFWNYEAESGSDPQDPALTADEAAANVGGLEVLFSALKSRVVLLGALFIFAYQGAEVSISGWIISFLISSRDGNPASVGYVTSGFWGGITIGRFLLTPLGAVVGEKRFVYSLVAGSAVFELLVWLVPNVVGNAVSVALVGLLLGPVYPCAAHVLTKNLSRREQVSGMGVVSAFGSSGGAVAPFTTGVIAQATGPFVLNPIAIGLFAAMTACWYGIPAIRRRNE